MAFISKLFMAYFLVSLDVGISMTEVSTNWPIRNPDKYGTATRIECTVFNPFSYGGTRSGGFSSRRE